MPIAGSDIVFRLSVVTGSAGDSTAQGDANQSLGKYISTTVAAETLHGLFDLVTGDDNAASDVEYRCIFVLNNHGSLTLESAVAWLSAETAGGCDAAISVDATGVTPKGQAGAQAKEVANESTAPTGETFSAPTSKATGISIGNIPAGQCQAIWLRRTATNSAALDNDSVTVRVEGDSPA